MAQAGWSVDSGDFSITSKLNTRWEARDAGGCRLKVGVLIGTPASADSNPPPANLAELPHLLAA